MTAVLCLALCALVISINADYHVDIEAPKDALHLEEAGHIKDVNGKRVLVKSGDFAYESPEHVPVHEQWSADEKGFKAQGNRLPTPPPIPLAIRKSLVKEGVKPPFGPGSQ